MKLFLSLMSVIVSATPLASAQNLAEVAVTNGFSTLVAAVTASSLAPALVDPAFQLSKFRWVLGVSTFHGIPLRVVASSLLHDFLLLFSFISSRLCPH
jgi:hypothetical protein